MTERTSYEPGTPSWVDLSTTDPAAAKHDLRRITYISGSLIEVEELSAPAVAELLKLPLGTVASRLRRARQAFVKAVESLRVDAELEGRDG